MVRIFIKAIAFIIAYTFFSSLVFAGKGKYDAFQVTVSGHGQPMILIPGATCSGDEWKETIAHFGDKYEYHVITIAGYAGVPALPNPPYLETVKNQLEQYITDNKLKNVILVGHSIGGFLSLWIASETHTNLSKVVVIDAMPFFAGAGNPNAADTFSEAQAKAMMGMYNKMSDSTFMLGQRRTASLLCFDSSKWDRIVKWGITSEKRTMAYTMAEMLGNDLRKKIADINIPVLVLAAYAKFPDYPDYTRQSVIDMYASQYKACTTCTVHTAEDKTKHFIMYDNPVWMYKEMDSFLKGKQ